MWGEGEQEGRRGRGEDLCGYLHDQTLRQLNRGYTGAEITETFEMPPALEREWSAHGY